MKTLSGIGLLLAALTPCLHASMMTEYFQGTITGAYVDGVDPGGIYDASRGSIIYGSFSFDLASGSGCAYSVGPSGTACVNKLPVTITLSDTAGSETVIGPNLPGMESYIDLVRGTTSALNRVEFAEVVATDSVSSAGIYFALPNGTLTDLTAFPWGTQTVIPIDRNYNSGKIWTYNALSSGVYSYGDLQFSVDSLSLSPMPVVASPEPGTFVLVGVLLGAVISFTRARSGSQCHLGN